MGSDHTMTSDKPKTRRWGFLRIALAIAILATLIVPSTRELHQLNLMLLFRIRGERTFVQGQPAGCVLYFVPNVQFTETYRERCYENAASSPEAFLQARSMTWQPSDWPAPATWIDDPLQEWAATELTSRYLSTRRQLATASQPADRYRSATVPARDHVLAVVHRAQQAHPDNGALWLAEAALQFDAGDDDAGLRALEIAADKPFWNNLGNVIFTHLREALQTQGLPCFDATLEAHGIADVPGFSLSIMRENVNHLVRLLTTAVRTSDRDQVSYLLSLWHDLQHGAWRNPPIPNGFSRVPVSADEPELVESMARQLNQELPEWDPSPALSDNTTWEARQAARDAWTHAAHELFDDYVREAVGDDLATAFRTEHQTMEAALEQIRARRHAQSQSILAPTFASSAAGSTALLLLAWTLGALVLEIPFRVKGRFQNRGRRQFEGWLFYPLAFAGCAAMAALIHSAADATHQTVGMRDLNYKPLLEPRQENAIGALLIPILWFSLRLCMQKLNRFRGVAWMSICTLYLVAVVVTAHYRTETIRAAEAVCSFQVTTDG